MNGKATVSKQLNEKHIKILEGLLKSPENRECADCKTRAPRWASVNLGVFICMQCSGIHRSLGVHISKVRSTTLDTWLPDQVAKMQAMGNVKSNAYWEAELPPNYDRIGIENFVRAKYIEKKWVSRDGKSYSPAMAKEEVTSAYKSRSRSLDGHGHHNASQHSHQETKDFHSLPTEEVVLASTSRPGSSHSQRSSSGCQNQHQEKKYNYSPSRLGSSNSPRSIVPDLPKVSRLATTPGTAVDSMKTAEPRKPKVKTEVAEPMPISRPLEVDYGTELFMMLSSNNFAANDTNEPPSENNAWVKFESDEAIPSVEEKFLLEPVKSKTPFETSVQQNPKALVLSVQEPSHLHPKDMKRDHLSMQDNNQDPQKDMSGKPQDSQKDARKDLVSYPKYYTEEPQKDQKTNNQKTDVQSNMASNESIHHQRLALLVQDESVLSGPPAKPLPAPQIWLKQHQSHANGIHAPYTHGEDLKRGALRAQIEQSNHPKMQGTRPSSIARTMSVVAANSHPYAPSMYKPANPINGTANGAVKKQNPRLPVSPHDYDFSILTQGLFTKQ